MFQKRSPSSLRTSSLMPKKVDREWTLNVESVKLCPNSSRKTWVTELIKWVDIKDRVTGVDKDLVAVEEDLVVTVEVAVLVAATEVEVLVEVVVLVVVTVAEAVATEI